MEETKMRSILALGVLLAAASLPALAVNFSGKWEIQGDTGGAGGRGVTVLILNQVGDDVTGTVNAPIEPWTNSPLNSSVWGGKVEKDTLSFYVWTGTDQPAKAHYRGTISASGEEIVFTVTRARGGPTEQVTARRVK
jgi:hypothetical protein